MSVIKLTKKDIIKKDDEDKKIKLNRNQISYDSALVSGWETDADESFGTLQKYREKLDKGEYLSSDDLNSYKSAMDSYVENSNRLRGINKTFGKGYTEEEEKQWNDSVTSFQTNYDDVFNYYSKWKTEDEYNLWYESYKKSLEEAERLKELANSEQASKGWGKYITDESKATEEDQPKGFLEKMGYYLSQGTSDTTLPTVGETNAVVNAYRNADSYKKPNDDWTEEQKNIFGALYWSDSKEAENYAITINNSINLEKEKEAIKKIQESATSNFFAGAGHTLGAIASSPLGLADYLNDLAMSAAGRPITADGNVSPFEYSQAVTEGVSTKLNDMSGTLNENIPIIGGKGLGDVYGLGTSIAQSLASAYTLGSAGTLISYFGQGAASGVDDALSRGATEGQAVLYGTSLGVFEGLAEYVGVDNLFKLGSSATVKGFIKNILNQAGAEGAEEGLTSLFSNIADNVIMQDKSNFNALVTQYMAQGMSESEAKRKAWMNAVEGIAFDTIAGAVSGGVSGSLHTSVANIIANKEASQLYGNGAELVAEAKEIGGEAGTLADKYQAKLDKGKSLSGGQINRLVEANENAMVSQDKAKMQTATETRLTELGENGDISSIAKVIVKQASGEKLTKSEKALLQNSKYGQRVVNEITPSNVGSGEYSNAWAENIGTERINTEEYNLTFETENSDEVTKKALLNVATATPFNTNEEIKATETNISPTEEKAIESKFEVSAEGKNVNKTNDEIINIVGIESIKDGEMVLKVENDEGKTETVNAKDVAFGTNDDVLIYSAVADMGASESAAWNIVKNFKATDGVSANVYAQSVPFAYKYGLLNYQAGLKNLDLTTEQAMVAFYQGRNDAESKLKRKVNNPTTATAKNKTASKGKGKVIFEGFKYDESTANDLQKSSMAGINLIAEISPLEVHVYKSFRENGKLMAYVNGKKRLAPNGYFIEGTNKIYIDINAGAKGEGLMLDTAGHEITHYIAEWNWEGFKELGDFLFEHYGADVPVDTLINTQKQRIIGSYKRDGKPIPSEDELFRKAYEETVADAMSKMLADERAYTKLAELKQQNQTLWEKIGEAIKNLLDKIKSLIGVYSQQGATFKESEYVEQFSKDVYEKLQDLYVKAFVEANETVATIGARNFADFTEAKNTEGEALFQYRAMEADESTYRDMLKKWGKMTDVQIDNLFGTIDRAMDIIKDNLEVLDYAWEADIDDRAFSPVKPNSDSLYQVSLDFSTLCRKRILQQTIQAQLQEALNQPLTREEGIAIRDALMALQEEGRQIEVACALCYVESARMKSPAQIKKFLNNRESVIKDFFAGKSGGSMKDKIKRAETDAREKLHKENPKGIKGKDGSILDPRTASLKAMPKKYADAIRDAKKAAKESYKPTAEEQKLIDVAKGMSVSDFTSPEGLENLAKNYPALFDAYTSYIRNATKSKGIEGDTWWRAGDSQQIGDVLIANMNRENGLRSQSWSDFQVIHILDYIAATIELSTRNAKEQAYSKVPDYVELMGQTGVMINMSLIPTREFTGTLDYDSVEGMAYKRALELREKYPATAGTICIGVDNKQIQMLLADATIDYVIPYHKSGMAATVRKLMHIPTWSQYEEYQSEKTLSRKEAEAQAKRYGVKLLAESDPNYHKHTAFSEWFDLEVAKQIAKMENSNPSNKAMQKKYGVMYGGYMAMQDAANNYLKLCAERGIAPKFSHEKANFTVEDNYWKLLIDRKMVNNATGEIIEQQTIKPIFDEGEVLRILNDELERYPSVKADQDYATRKVTEKFLSGEIKSGMSAKAIAEVMKTPVDNITKTNILASAEGEMMLSDRDSEDSKAFARDINQWNKDGRPDGESFILGSTGDVLQGLGAIESDIYMLGDKINEILSEHPEMTLDEIKKIPQILENPVLILKSKNIGRNSKQNTRMVIFGTVKAKNGKPILTVLDLRPVEKRLVIDDMQKVSSSYTKTVNPVDFIKQSDVLYADKNKTTKLLRTIGFKMPIELQLSGYIGSISYKGQNVNIQGETFSNVFKENSENLYSERDLAPIFYSQMGKVVEGVKQEKLAANSVVNMLRGKGVKAEEIRWSGIVPFLEGKKSVTKQELLDFINGSMLQIGEQEIAGSEKQELWDDFYRKMHSVIPYFSVEEIEEMCFDYDGEFSAAKFNSVLEEYVEDGTISEDNFDEATEYAEEMEKGLSDGTKWSKYKLDGGYNYRELLFTMPKSTYSNQAMRAHWGNDAKGILSHARIQDFNVGNKRMLFIEEIQSDWHNAGQKYGYGDNSEALEQARSKQRKLKSEYDSYGKQQDALREKRYIEIDDYEYQVEMRKLVEKETAVLNELQRVNTVVDNLEKNRISTAPDAPFKDNYHEFVLKRLIRMAAEQGYDSIGWTPADIQSKRWSYDYEKAYKIEYDQEMPKFLKKYGRQWGAKVGKTDIQTKQLSMEEEMDNALLEDWIIDEDAGETEESVAEQMRNWNGLTSVWSMDITDSMKESVLYEGQVMYSERVTDKETLDFLNEQMASGEVTKVYRAMQAQPVDENGNVIRATVIRVVSQSPLKVEAKTFGKNGKVAIYPAKLFSPMAGMVNGKWSKSIGLNEWEQTTFDLAHATAVIDEKTGKPKIDNDKKNASYGEIAYYYGLVKGGIDDDGKALTPIPARYNPYIHTSLSALNDQFSSANKRPELVTVECIIPNSELTSGFRAEGAKDRVGAMNWHSGPTSSRLAKVGKARTVILTRYDMPVRVLPDSEVAKAVAKYVGDTENIAIQGSTVTPSLSRELMNLGISVLNEEQWSQYNKDFPAKTFGKKKMYSDRDTSTSNRSILANALEGAAQSDIEKNKLAQYKEKIALIETEEQRLSEIQKQLFTKGAVEPSERKDLQFEAKQIANRINTYDRQLLNLESTTALKNVLNREKALAMKRQKQKDADAMRKYKEKVAETQRELLERNKESRKKAIESREKTAMRHKIKSVVNDLNNLLLKPSKERHVPEEMRIAVAEALALINMDTVDADTRVAKYNDLIAKAKDPDVIASLTETRDRILNQGNKLADKLTKLKEAYSKVRDSADDSVRSMYDDVIYSRIETVQNKVGKTPLRNMTLEQLESVYDLYKMVLTTIRDSNKAFAENITMTRLALGSNTFAEIKDNNKARDTIKHESIEKFMWQNLKPMQAMKTIGSGTLQKLWNNVLYGQEVFAVDYDEAVKFAKEMKEKYGYKKWNLDKLYSFESKSGKAMKINLEQMMSIYAYSKRAQADEHIEYGGIVLNEGIRKEKNKWGKVVEVKVNDSTAYRLDKMQVANIVATLEKEFPGAKAFVDEMQKYLSETMGEKGNEVSMKMYDIKLFKEEHYFPLKSSKDFMEAANAKLKGDVKIKNKGMTKSTVEHARNPIVLENFLDVWGNHINEMAMYHGLVLPLEDFSRTLNYSFKADDSLNTDAESVRTALHDAFGDNADNYLNELLKAINGGVLHDSSAQIADKMISKFKKAKVMASLSVVVQQPTAIIRAMGIIDPKYFVAQNLNHKATWEELKKYCPTAIIKETGSFDTNMGRTIVDMIKDERGFTDKVGDVLGKAPAYMDEVGWNMIWRALKKKVATEQKLSGEELLQECGKQMTLIINETQVYDSVMSRNELMRSKNALTKMATAFMAEPSTVANMIYGAGIDFKRGKKGIAGKTVAAVISSVVVNGLVSAMVYALRDDDDEKTLLEKYLSSATTEVLDGLNPLTYIPFVKDAYSLFQGYKVERTDMALIKDVVDAIDSFYNVLDPEAYEGMSREEIAKHIYDNSVPLLTSICDMFGLPVGNILRDAEAIIINDNVPMSQTSSSGTGAAFKEGWLGTLPAIVGKVIGTDTKTDKLYDAIVSGDTTYISRLKSGYKDDKAYETAVRKALRENDSRIRKAAELRKNGEVTECFKIIDKIAKEKHFTRTQVISAVNAELEKLKKAEK